ECAVNVERQQLVHAGSLRRTVPAYPSDAGAGGNPVRSVAMASLLYAGCRGSVSERSLRNRSVAALAGFITETASRHLARSIGENAAGTSSSLPPWRRFQHRRPSNCLT